MRSPALLVSAALVLGAFATVSAGILPPPDMRPDLVAGEPGVWPQTEGAASTVRFGFSNAGDASASGVSVRVYLDGVLFEEATSGEVARGRSAGFASTASWTVTAGWHELRVVVDPADAVAEHDEGNNEVVRGFEVRDRVELRIVDIAWSPEDPVVGDTMTFTATVANVGAVDAPAGSVSFGTNAGTIGTSGMPAVPVGGSVEVVSPPSTAGRTSSQSSVTSSPSSDTAWAWVYSASSLPLDERRETFSVARPGLIAVSGGDARGAVAVSLTGDARGVVAVSGTGEAHGAYAAASGLGDAAGHVAAASVAGDATSHRYATVPAAVSPFGEARGSLPASATGTCNGKGCLVADPDGDAHGEYAGVSGTGDASGRWASATGTGDAECTEWVYLLVAQECLAASGTGDAYGIQAVAPLGDASSRWGSMPVSVMGTCEHRACADVRPSGDASGHYAAASGDGDADAYWIAVAPVGDGSGPFLVASGTGAAGSRENPAYASVSGTGPSHGGHAAVSGTGRAWSVVVPVSGTGHADGQLGVGANYCDGVECFAVAPDGDARGHWLAASSGGAATGDMGAVAVGGDAECSYFPCVAVAGAGCARGAVAVDACGLS